MIFARASLSTSPRTTVANPRSEEHTSELQSLAYLVCRLLLEKNLKEGFDLGRVDLALFWYPDPKSCHRERQTSLFYPLFSNRSSPKSILSVCPLFFLRQPPPPDFPPFPLRPALPT